MTGNKRVVHWTSETWYKCSEIAGSPQAPPQHPTILVVKEDLQWAWNQDRKAVWDQVGLSNSRHDGLVTVRDKAHLRRGHNGQLRRGHKYSETRLTGESQFHISTPLGIEPVSLMMGSKQVVHWTSETWYECCEIAGSPQYIRIDSELEWLEDSVVLQNLFRVYRRRYSKKA